MQDNCYHLETKNRYPKKIEVSIVGNLCGPGTQEVMSQLVNLIKKIPETLLFNLKNMNDIDSFGIVTLAKVRILAQNQGVNVKMINYDHTPKSNLVDLAQSQRVLLF